MTNSEKQTRLDLFEIANMIDVPARDVFGAQGAWEAVNRARRASRRLFAADIRRANEGTSTDRAFNAARKACGDLDDVFMQLPMTSNRLAANVVTPGGGFRYIEISSENGARYFLGL